MDKTYKESLDRLEKECETLKKELTIAYVQIRMSLKIMLEYANLLEEGLDVEEVLYAETESVYKKVTSQSDGISRILSQLKSKGEDIERYDKMFAEAR